jgi:hypothetical protein
VQRAGARAGGVCAIVGTRTASPSPQPVTSAAQASTAGSARFFPASTS